MSLANLNRRLASLEESHDQRERPYRLVVCLPSRWPDPALAAAFDRAIDAGDPQRAAQIAALAEDRPFEPHAHYHVVAVGTRHDGAPV